MYTNMDRKVGGKCCLNVANVECNGHGRSTGDDSSEMMLFDFR